MSWITQSENQSNTIIKSLILGIKDALNAHSFPDDIFALRSKLSEEKNVSILAVGLDSKKVKKLIFDRTEELKKLNQIYEKAEKLKLLL
jgi:enolase